VLISKEDLQRRRTPAELRGFAESVRAAVRASPHDMREGTLKTGLYKEFLDEVLPLSYFGERAYPGNFTIEPVLGNQGFDAVVYDKYGRVYERLELTLPHDGAESAEDARLRVARGFGVWRVGSPCDDFALITPYVMQTCKRKAAKDYSDARLVIIVRVLPPFAGFEDRYEDCVRKLCAQIREIQFRAAGVTLFLPPSRIEAIDG
jgi:hypothetical protein